MDVAISVALAIVTVAIGWLGFQLSIHPLPEEPSARAKAQKGYKVAFLVLSLLGVVLVTTQGVRTQQAQNAANTSQNALDRKVNELGKSSQDTKRFAAEASRMQVLNTKLQEQLLEQGRSITRLARENIMTTTGGDSFCYVALLGSHIDQSGGIPIVIHSGRYPLRNVTAEIVDVSAWTARVADRTLESALSAEATLQVGDIGPETTKMYQARVPFRQGDSQVFLVRFSAQNGFWNEQLLVRLVDGVWRQAIRVLRP